MTDERIDANASKLNDMLRCCNNIGLLDAQLAGLPPHYDLTQNLNKLRAIIVRLSNQNYDIPKWDHVEWQAAL